jgi:hypothetical protein
MNYFTIDYVEPAFRSEFVYFSDFQSLIGIVHFLEAAAVAK